MASSAAQPIDTMDEILSTNEVLSLAHSWEGDVPDAELFLSVIEQSYAEGDPELVKEIVEILLLHRENVLRQMQRVIPLVLEGQLLMYLGLTIDDGAEGQCFARAAGLFDEARRLCVYAGVSAVEVDECQARMGRLRDGFEQAHDAASAFV